MIQNQLLDAVGQACGLQGLQFNDQQCARLLVDGTLSVQFEYHDERRLLHIYSSLGSVPASDRESLFRALLEANLFGQETAGATLAIDKLQRDIVLWQSVPVDGTAPEALVDHVKMFIDTADDWQKRIGTLAASPAASVATADTDLASRSRVLRV